MISIRTMPSWGVLIVLAVCLYSVWSHWSESERRLRVLSVGKPAEAIVRGFSGVDYVTVEWQDSSGRTRRATAWTGSSFPRTYRENPYPLQTTTVDIKYVDEDAMEPVILGEAAERDRINTRWINNSIALAALMGITIIWGVLRHLWLGRVRGA
jgi:hypothetical protein